MVGIIQDLLLTNNCVIIPGLGAFLGNYNPAEIQLMENKIYPPAKTIAFNRSLQTNDGLLISAVSQEKAISYQDAEEKVNAFVKECNESLSINKSVIFKNIGRLLLDDEHILQFQPYKQKNYLLESFGLESLSLYPIQRLKDDAAALKETYQRTLHPELLKEMVKPEKRRTALSYWVTTVLAIAFLATSLGWNIHKSNLNQSYSSLFPDFENKSTLKTPVIHPEKKVVNTLNTEQAPELSPPAVIATVTQQPAPVVQQPVPASLPVPVVKTEPDIVKTSAAQSSKTYIVIGAFFDEVHANKVKAETEAKGYVVIVVNDFDNSLFRLCVEVTDEDAAATLQKIKSDYNQRAWVYCSNCNLK